jgi:hypothetical protein
LSVPSPFWRFQNVTVISIFFFKKTTKVRTTRTFNACRIHGGFCRPKVLFRTPLKTSPPNQWELPHVQAANQRRVYPHVLNRQRWAARQLLFIVDNARAGDFQPRFWNSTLS